MRDRKPYRCLWEGCNYVQRRDKTVTHVLRHHIVEERVPHMCTLCGFRCCTVRRLKGHRTTHSPHKNALKRTREEGRVVNEDDMEFHSENPVNVNRHIEAMRERKKHERGKVFGCLVKPASRSSSCPHALYNQVIS